MIEIDPFFAFDRPLFPGFRRGGRVILSGCIAAPVLLAQTVVTKAPPPEPERLAYEEPAALPPLPEEKPTPALPSEPASPEPVPAEPIPIPSAAVPDVSLADIDTRKWKVFTSLDVRGTYDDNIYIRDTFKEADFYFTVAPGLSFGWGDYKDQVKAQDEFDHVYHISLEEMGEERNNFVFASYTPSWTTFLDHSSENTFNHNLVFDSEFEFSRLSVGVNSQFETLDAPDIDIGNRVHREIFTIAAHANYSFTDKTSLQVKLSDTNREYRDELSSNEVVDENWLNYQMMPKTNVGLGLILGRLSVAESDSQTYEQLQLGVTWLPTSKLSLRANGGTEVRQTNADEGNKFSGVFGLGVSYQPFDGTDIGLDAYRRTENSAAFPGDNYTATSLSARIKQRFFQRVYGSILGGYTHTEYDQAADSLFSERRDNFVYGEVQVGFDLTKWSSIELSYQYRTNDSTLADTTFHQNIATIRANVLF